MKGLGDDMAPTCHQSDNAHTKHTMH